MTVLQDNRVSRSRLPRAVAAVALLLLVASLAAGTADAKIYKGKTSAGKSAKLETGRSDRVKFVNFEFRAKCRRSGYSFRGAVGARRPFDSDSSNRFADRDGFKGRDGRLRYRYRQEVTGVRKTERLWKGTFALRIRVFRGSRSLDTCRTGELNWYAQSKR